MSLDLDASKSTIREDHREEMTHNFNDMLEQMGLAIFPLKKGSDVPSSQWTNVP